MIGPLLMLAFLGVQDDPARRWIEGLRSDLPEERRQAEDELRRMGYDAVPALRRVSAIRDPVAREVVQRLLRRAEIRVRLPRRVVDLYPGIEDRLAAGGDPAWLREFLVVFQEDANQDLTPEELAPFAARAARGVRTEPEASHFCSAIEVRGVRRATPELVPLLGSPNEEVVGRVRATLFLMRAWEAVPALVAAMEGPFRRHAAEVLRGLPAPEAVPLLMRHLDSTDGALREATIRLLADLGSVTAASGIRERLADEIPGVRAAAADALAALGEGEAAPRLRARLDDPDETVRASAARALGLLGAEDAAPSLRARLRDASAEVRVKAAHALGMLASRRSLPDLLGLLEDKEPDVREAAVLAVSDLRAPEAAIPLVIFLKTPGALSETSVASALESLRAPECVPALIPLLDHDDGAIRSAAARLLGVLGARESVPDLLRLLKDEDVEIAETAARALVRLRAKEAAPGIARLLDEESERTRLLALNLLGKLGAPEAAPSIVRFLQVENSDLRQAAVRALCLLGSREGVPQVLDGRVECDLLNAVAEPELWARWEAEAPRLKGTALYRVAQLAGAAGMGLAQWPAERFGQEEGQGYEPSEPGDVLTLRDYLRSILKDHGCTMILAPEGLRVVDHDEAVKHWTAWWEDARR